MKVVATPILHGVPEAHQKIHLSHHDNREAPSEAALFDCALFASELQLDHG